MNKSSEVKNVLFIGTLFYTYHNDIIAEIEKSLPAKVDFISQPPTNKRYLQIISPFVNPEKLLADYLQKIIEKWIDQSDRKYDYIFVLKGNLLTFDIMDRLKKEFPDAIYIYYAWDSFELYPHSLKISKYFDRKFSFDRNDCLKNAEFNYLPLFHNFKHNEQNMNCPEFDLFFIGAYRQDRIEFLEKIIPQCEKHGIRTMFYIPIGKKRYLYYKTMKKHSSLLEYFNFKNLSYDQYFSLLSKTRTVIDLEHPQQDGLTMRTIESLSLNKKLITTNKFVKKESFYNPNNIMVVERDDPHIDPEFINSEFETDDNFWEKYSLKTWVKTLFDLKE